MLEVGLLMVCGAGYGHVAPKTSWGQVVTIIYAIFGIPLTLLTITNLGSFMATAFRFIYRNVCCTLCCICCICCRLPSPPVGDVETGYGNKNPAVEGGPDVNTATRWSTIRKMLINTNDIRGVQVRIILLLTGIYILILSRDAL